MTNSCFKKFNNDKKPNEHKSIDFEKCQYNFTRMAKIMLFDWAHCNTSEGIIEGDHKFYLKHQNYRLEIRSRESSVYLAYIALPYLAYDNYVSETEKAIQSLFVKYLKLIEMSDKKHFDFIRDE